VRVEGSAISDADFKRAGAQLINSADQVWAEAETAAEGEGADRGRVLTAYARARLSSTYLHLAASKPCTDALLASGTTVDRL